MIKLSKKSGDMKTMKCPDLDPQKATSIVRRVKKNGFVEIQLKGLLAENKMWERKHQILLQQPQFESENKCATPLPETNNTNKATNDKKPRVFGAQFPSKLSNVPSTDRSFREEDRYKTLREFIGKPTDHTRKGKKHAPITLSRLKENLLTNNNKQTDKVAPSSPTPLQCSMPSSQLIPPKLDIRGVERLLHPKLVRHHSERAKPSTTMTCQEIQKGSSPCPKKDSIKLNTRANARTCFSQLERDDDHMLDNWEETNTPFRNDQNIHNSLNLNNSNCGGLYSTSDFCTNDCCRSPLFSSVHCLR